MKVGGKRSMAENSESDAGGVPFGGEQPTGRPEGPTKPAATGPVRAIVVAIAVCGGAALWWLTQTPRDEAEPTRATAPTASSTAPTDDSSNPQPNPTMAAQADLDPAAEPLAADGNQDDSDPAGGAAGSEAAATSSGSPSLRIVAWPERLRVWANTRVALRVEATGTGDGEAASFERFVWHFEDGSAPAEGRALEHDFPESVRDRHVTVEGFRHDGSREVASLRMAVERLEVVPVDGEAKAGEAPRPERSGPRLILVGGRAPADQLEKGLKVAFAAGASAVIAWTDAATAEAIAIAATAIDPNVPVLLVRMPRADADTIAVDEAPAAAALLEVVRDSAGRVTPLGRSGGIEALAIDGVAFAAVDTRGATVAEDELAALSQRLEFASAFPHTLLLSPRPLAPYSDGDMVADRSYRIYELALRNGNCAVLSGSSGVAWNGRLGGLVAVAVGSLHADPCHRVLGETSCQAATITLLDVPAIGRIRASHLQLHEPHAPLAGAALPPEVGRYRR